jgi:hypothetical protein
LSIVYQLVSARLQYGLQYFSACRKSERLAPSLRLPEPVSLASARVNSCRWRRALIISGWDQLERGGAGYSYKELLLTKTGCGFMLRRPSNKTIRSFPGARGDPRAEKGSSPWRHLRVRTRSSRRAFGVELPPFGALRASSTIHVRRLGGSPSPSVALLVHQLREGLAPLGQCQASALRR